MRKRTDAGPRTTSWPSTSARPPSGRSTVARILTAVVLPAPFGPSSPKTVPTGTSKSMPLSAATLPKCLASPSTRMAVSVTGRFCHRCCNRGAPALTTPPRGRWDRSVAELLATLEAVEHGVDQVLLVGQAAGGLGLGE